MIDTIVLRIHNLEKYESLIDFILSDRKGTSNGFATEKDVTHLRFQYLHFTETNHSMMIYKTHIKVPSSNYDVSICYVQFKSYVEISFSVPKYLYGTNVLHFCKHQNQPYYVDMTVEQDLKKIFDYTFKMLGNFIRKFFQDVFPETCQPDFNDVEMKRLDLCYNQVFQSERDAKMFLMYQKMIKKKGARDMSQNKQTYETSIFYTTEYYAAKIYHKGTEYALHDQKKHEAANAIAIKKGESPPFEIYDHQGILGIKSVADRILRYEISFRKEFLQYYYWRYYYRKTVPLISEKKKLHRIMHNEKVSIRNTESNELRRQKILEFNQTYDKVHKTIYRDVQKLYDTAPRFMLGETHKMRVENLSDHDFFVGEKLQRNFSIYQPFNKFLWNQMVASFVDFYDQFQVKEKVYFNDSQKRISEFNEKMDVLKSLGLEGRKMYRGSIEKVTLLLQHYSMDELKRLGIIPKRTFYNWKKRLKELGIDQTNVATISIPVSKGNEYYHEVVQNSTLQFLLKFHKFD